MISLAQESVPDAAVPEGPAAPFNSDEVVEAEEVETAGAEAAVAEAAPVEPTADPVAADAAIVDALPVDVASAPATPEVVVNVDVPAMTSVPAAVSDASIVPPAAEIDTAGGAADPDKL